MTDGISGVSFCFVVVVVLILCEGEGQKFESKLWLCLVFSFILGVYLISLNKNMGGKVTDIPN